MLWVTLAFILGMGTIGYVVTRFPELLTNDNLALVDGVAVSVPSDRKPGELQIYRCRITKEHIMEPNSNRVATTVQKTVCGFEALDGP